MLDKMFEDGLKCERRAGYIFPSCTVFDDIIWCLRAEDLLGAVLIMRKHNMDINKTYSALGDTLLPYVLKTHHPLELLEKACQLGLDLVETNSQGVLNVHLLAMFGKPKDIYWAIEKDAIYLDMRDNEGNTTLMQSIKTSNNTVVRFLLNRKANIHTTNGYGETALHIAAKCQNHKAAQLLLQCRANKLAKDIYGMTPFDHAADLNVPATSLFKYY